MPRKKRMWAASGSSSAARAQIVDRRCVVSLAIVLHAALEARRRFVGHAPQRSGS